MIREDLIVDCMEGRADWEELNWDELELLQERIDTYISSISTDKTVGFQFTHKTLQ